MPSIVHDGTAFHAFWSARGFASNPDDARIVVSSSRDGRTWSNPGGQSQRAADAASDHSAGSGRGRTGPGRLDRHAEQRAGNVRPVTSRISGPTPPATPWRSTRRRRLSGPPHYIYRQSGDIYAAQAGVAAANGLGGPGLLRAQAISRYRFGLVGGVRRQLEYNFLNPRLFQKGAVAFNGDYHAVAGQRYRPSETTPGAWIRNTAPRRATRSSIPPSPTIATSRDTSGPGRPRRRSHRAGVTQQGESGFGGHRHLQRVHRRRRATKPCGPPATVRARASRTSMRRRRCPG